MNEFKRVKCALFNIFFGALLLLAMSHSALAQVTASITGRVQDASGAAIPGVTVTVTSLETGAARTIEADDSGSYRAVSLPVGRYEVKAEKAGFKTAVQTGITLTLGQQAVVNLDLQVGQVQQQVTVTSEAPLVNTTTAPTSGLVEEQEVKDLPLNGRSFDSLIGLNTGAYALTSLKNTGAGAQQGNVFSISGRRYGENQFTLNGVEYMGPSQVHSVPGGVSGQLLGIDAVREFNVLTDTYAAEYGKRAGGQINIVTMSGTNQLHGTAFEFVRNNVFDARNPFDSATLPKRIPPFKRNQFGGALGGPIKKDKTFVFGNYEGFRQRLGLSNVATVPDSNARLGILPCGTIVPLPAGCIGTSDTTPAPVPAAAGVPPGSMTTMLQYVNDYWPVGVDANPKTGVATAGLNPLQSIREDMGIARVDHTFSSKDTLGVSYLIDDGYNNNPQINPFWMMDVGIRSQVLSLQETHIFTAHLINNFTAGFSRATFLFFTPPNDAFNVKIPSNLIFVTGALPGRITVGGGGSTSGGTISAAGSTIVSDSTSARNAFTYSDNLQIIKGRHQISLGVWFQRLQSNELHGSDQSGVTVFTTLESMIQGTLLTGGSFAATPIISSMYWRQLEGAWYVQDNVQVRPNLTVQLGLRHEFNNGYNEKNCQDSNYQFVNNVYETVPTIGCGTYAPNNAVRLFGPRAAFAWDPFGKGKTSIRSGFGIHYSEHDTLGNSLDGNPPFNGILSFQGSDAAPVPFLSLVPISPATPFPPTCGPGVPGAVNPATGAKLPGGPCALYAAGGVNQNIKTPTVLEWNFSVEQGLGSNMSLRLAYVGSHGYHLVESDPNTVVSQFCNNAAGCLAGGTAKASLQTTVPQGALYVPVTPAIPNPYVSGGGSLDTFGISTYEGVSVELIRRLGAGLQFKANYTYSKELDISDGFSGDPGVGTAQDLWHPILTGYGPSGTNQLHRVVVSGSYELPFGKNKPFLSGATGVVDKLASGWQINTIVSALSGFPLTVAGLTRAQNAANGGGAGNASLNPNFTGSMITGKVNQWVNPAAFMEGPAGEFGNQPKNMFIGPNLRNVDISIFKTTAITERIKLQFRAEGFNVFNRTNYSNPLPGANTVFTGSAATPLPCVPAGITLGSGQIACGGSSAVSPTFSSIQSTATFSRNIQFGLKLIF